MTNKNNFIIASHGWSASNWLAYALSSHPDIVATHSAANLYNEQLTNDIKGKLTEFYQGYLDRQNMPIEQAYKKISSIRDARAYGSVHLYRLRDLPVLNDKYGPENQIYKTFNLVRHPVSLVMSGYGQFKELFKTDINELHWTLSKVIKDKETINAICERHNVLPGELDNLAFIGASCILGSLKLDLQAYGELEKIRHIEFIDTIKMEDITTNPESMITLLNNIDLNLTITEQFLKGVYLLDQINTHNKSNNKSPKEIFAELEPWQREILCFYLNKHNIKPAYESFGYDLCFIEDPR